MPGLGASNNFVEVTDVAYTALGDDGDAKLQSLDLYIPESIRSAAHSGAGDEDRDVALIVYVHGGAWRAEDKSLHTSLGRRWAQAFPLAVIAIPNYRLSPKVKHPVHTEDTELALHFLLSSPSVAPFTYSKVWLVGHSAGAHIISSILLVPPPPEQVSSPLKPKTPASKELLENITGVVLVEGIYDLDLLLQSFPDPFYRGFVEQAFCVRSESSLPPPSTSTLTSMPGPPEVEDAFAKRYGPASDRTPFADANITNFTLPPSGQVDHVQWVIVQSPGDDLVDFVQAEAMYGHLSELGKSEGNVKVTKEYEAVTGGHDESVQSEELVGLMKKVIFGAH